MTGDGRRGIAAIFADEEESLLRAPESPLADLWRHSLRCGSAVSGLIARHIDHYRTMSILLLNAEREAGMEAKLVLTRRTDGPLAGVINAWWVVDARGQRWEIFSVNRPEFSVQYDAGKDCGTGVFVLEGDQDLTRGSEFAGEIRETPVGVFGVPCQVEFVPAEQSGTGCPIGR